MILELILGLLVGVLAGTITGLFPGIHINLVSAFLLSVVGAGYFSGLPPISLVVFVTAMAITHTFLDFIPSIFLGAPEEDSFLAVLPGHRLLFEGNGLKAVLYSFYGCIASLPIIFIFSLLFIYFLDSIYKIFQIFIPYVLIFTSLYLVLREKEFFSAFVVFIFAGFLGLFTFKLPVREPLLPLLTGLFGVSGLIVSMREKISLPTQKVFSIREIGIDVKYFLRSFMAAFVSAPLFSFLPGTGSGYAAVVGSELMGKKADDSKSFLFLVGCISMSVMALSFTTVYAINKSRTGVAAAVNEILGTIYLQDLIIILATVFVTSFCAFFLGFYISKFFARHIGSFNYKILSSIIIGILFLVVILFSNWLGLVVLITGGAIGVFAILSGVKRIHLMGCLLIPTIVFYLTF